MRKSLSIATSLLILLVMYWQIDVAQLLPTLRQTNLFWLGIGLLILPLLVWFLAKRLLYMMPAGKPLSDGEALRLILMAWVLNVILPSKMGDFIKGYFLAQDHHISGSEATSIVFFEKGCELLSLLLLCLVGLLLLPAKHEVQWVLTLGIASSLIMGTCMLFSIRFARGFFNVVLRWSPARFTPMFKRLHSAWMTMLETYRLQPKTLGIVVALSLLVSFAQLIQIWFFIFALNAWVPLNAHIALMPLAILAGLLPLGFAGIGTRDAALVVLFSAYLSAPTAAALGLLLTFRYVVLGLMGLPVVGPYWNRVKRSPYLSNTEQTAHTGKPETGDSGNPTLDAP